ncbi:hypothetical protein [Campylobacter concisus]|uniref:hypothetical protein n=1 Tax=Campylobacter concisus TaxID=199 RepID=UPI003D20219B
MALVAIEYGLKNIFDDYDSFISPSNKTQNRDRLHKHHEILRVVKYWLPFIKIKDPEYLKAKFENLLGEYLVRN